MSTAAGAPDSDPNDANDPQPTPAPAAATERVKASDALGDAAAARGAQSPSPDDMPSGFVPV